MFKVSIIVPCYGVERFLDRCLNSIVNQTLNDIEIILIDDGSPDRVPEMCDDWARKDSRIKVVHKENGGLGFARNSGIDVAEGEYVAFVDSDDFVDVKMYETLYAEASRLNADAVFCGWNKETFKNAWIKKNDFDAETIIVDKDSVQKMVLDMVASAPHERLERKYEMSVWHGIYRKKIIDSHNIRFESERVVASEDLPFQVDFLLNSRKVIFVPQFFYYYCLNGTSITAVFKKEHFDRFKYLRNLLMVKLNGVPFGEERCNRFFIGYVRSHLSHLYKTDIPQKKKIVENIVYDKYWDDITQNYPHSNLPFYHRIVYRLICDKKITLLIVVLNLARVALLLRNRIISKQIADVSEKL